MIAIETFNGNTVLHTTLTDCLAEAEAIVSARILALHAFRAFTVGGKVYTRDEVTDFEISEVLNNDMRLISEHPV